MAWAAAAIVAPRLSCFHGTNPQYIVTPTDLQTAIREKLGKDLEISEKCVAVPGGGGGVGEV